MSRMIPRQIYLDYNASTPIDPRVASVMSEAVESAFGNPSSTHWAGAPAHALVETARQQVADLLGCSSNEIVFTSGGSESNNLALMGLHYACEISYPHIITTQVEHPSILEPCRFLERLGAKITRLPVDATGRADPDDFRKAITPSTILISIMHANNEVGTIQPIGELSGIAREHDIPFHTDAAQSVGKLPTRVDELGVDLLSIAGHKLYAPKGIGALYVRSGIELEPLIHGASHERALRDRFWVALQEAFGYRVTLNGHLEERLPNTLNVSFAGQVGAEILDSMPEIAASTGSACHSGRVALSPVLEAMRVSPDVGAGAIRFSLGRATTAEEIDIVIKRLTGQLPA